MKTVLILDDDLDLRILLGNALEARGLAVLQAGSVAQARELLCAHEVHAAVVDGLLPDGTGMEFIAELRRHNREISLVFMSGHFRDLTTFTRLVGEFDVALVLYKPIDTLEVSLEMEQLLTCINVEPKVAEPAPGPSEKASETVLEEDEIQSGLARLCRDFRERLPGKLAELEQAITVARQDADHLEHARTLAHRLHGSAGSFGLHDVGKAVGHMEEMLSSPSFPADLTLQQNLSKALRDLQRAVLYLDSEGLVGTGPGQPALLVVDDDLDFLALSRGIAAKLEVPVVVAEDCLQALTLAEQHRLLGAVVDVHLGQDKGFQLARDIRDTEGNGEIPIAFASVDHCIETRVCAMAAGATRFFDKPISQGSLSGLVQQFVNLSQERRSRILIVDDDPTVVAVYTRILRSADFFVESLPCAEHLVERLETSRPDLLLLDVELPRMSGLDICRALRMSDHWDLLPILIVSASVDAERRLRAFQAGASDVLSKPIVSEELLARVKVQLDRARLLQERTDRDSLSGLLLRRAFLEACQRSLAGCSRARTPLSIALLDLDHFKFINDQYGHSAGDRVIAALGELLRRRFRTEDLRCRWGGEEFLLAFPGQTGEFAELAATQVLKELSQRFFVSDSGESFQSTFTAGVAAFPQDGTSLVSLVRHADALLYEGKRAGRNQVRRVRQYEITHDRR